MEFANPSTEPEFSQADRDRAAPMPPVSEAAWIAWAGTFGYDAREAPFAASWFARFPEPLYRALLMYYHTGVLDVTLGSPHYTALKLVTELHYTPPAAFCLIDALGHHRDETVRFIEEDRVIAADDKKDPILAVVYQPASA